MNIYSEHINDELMSELLEANRIKNIFNAVPLKIHSFVGNSDRAWNAFGKILRGERWYMDVRKGFGKWKYLWGLASFFSGMIEKRKEKKAVLPPLDSLEPIIRKRTIKTGNISWVSRRKMMSSFSPSSVAIKSKFFDLRSDVLRLRRLF